MRFSCAVKSVNPSMYTEPLRAKPLYSSLSARSVRRSAASVRSEPTAAEKAAEMRARSVQLPAQHAAAAFRGVHERVGRHLGGGQLVQRREQLQLRPRPSAWPGRTRAAA